jgi:hypothetical protein
MTSARDYRKFAEQCIDMENVRRLRSVNLY